MLPARLDPPVFVVFDVLSLEAFHLRVSRGLHRAGRL